MSYSEIVYEVKGATARITLNRPEKRNPLGPTTIGELLHALDCAKADEVTNSVAPKVVHRLTILAMERVARMRDLAYRSIQH